MGTGQTPRWLAAAIKVAFARGGDTGAIVPLPKPKRQPAQRRPQKPKTLDGLDIPVFVAGPRNINALARPALSLQSVGLRLNGDRAQQVQPKTPSLSGGRRGGE